MISLPHQILEIHNEIFESTVELLVTNNSKQVEFLVTNFFSQQTERMKKIDRK